MRRKSIIGFGVLLFIGYVLIQSIFVYDAYNSIKEELGNRAADVSKIVRFDIPVEAYKDIVHNKVKNDTYYKLQNRVLEIKRITNAKSVYVENKIDNNTIEYIIDSDGETLGETDENQDNLSFASNQSTTLRTTTAKWGQLVTGFTPILDESNNVIGLVGVDYEFGPNTELVKGMLENKGKSLMVTTLFLIMFIGILYNINKTNSADSKKLYGDVVASLTIILSKKSDYTWRHSENVANISEALASKFFRDKENLETVRWAGLLHDIGKIGISEDILNKPGRLTEEEFEIIKKHPVYSKQMLENIFNKKKTIFSHKEIEIISDIAKYHHERWDGNGYPCGLKGEDIPLMARIVSVADAYEAMTAERPYKKPMSKDEALNQIKKCSGNQFDPDIVSRFMECIDEGKI